MVSISRLILPVSLIVAFRAVNCLATGEDETVNTRICLQKALDAAKRIDDRQLREEVLWTVGLTQVAARDLQAARRTIEESKEAETIASVLAAIGLAQAKANDAAAGATLAEARAGVGRVSHPRSRELLLHAILEVYATAREDAEAIKIARSFHDRIDEAYGLLAIAKVQIAQRRREQARATVAMAAGANSRSLDVFDLSVWDQILDLYLELGQVAEAAKLAHALPKGHYERCNALCSLGRYQAKTGGPAAETFAEAFQAASDITNDDPCRKVHMAAVVQALVDAGDLAGAMKRARLLPDSGSEAIVLGAIAGSKAKSGDQAAARTLLHEALGIAHREKDGYERVDALASLAVRQAAIGDRASAGVTLAKAWEAAGKIESDGLGYGLAVARVAEAQLEMGDRRSAEKTLLKAAQRARAVSAAEYRANAASTIAKSQIAAGFHVAAQATSRDVLLPSLPLDTLPDNGYQEASILLAKAGDFASGYVAAQKIREPGPQSWAVRTVAFYQAIVERTGEPPAVARQENPLLKSAVYLGTALGLLNRQGIEVRSHYGVLFINEMY